ncbi:hypothetical protein PMZ80_002594 [Knufia obscura]|uniref:Uncharacterized protein n=1 Tax=Knufia obscura TaxID=1635080 RepID=A0ABR0RXS9_9EURO|nr:hypothetical protein PMZ80_002594 [Knufia obscura]
MSDYDRWARSAGWESGRVTVRRALARSGGLSVNSPYVHTDPAPQLPEVNQDLSADPTRYPNYHRVPHSLGYNPGETIVFRPTDVANPPPVQNQHQYTSDHTYSNFSSADLPPILFRLEPYHDIFRYGARDIDVPFLYDATTRQQIVTRRGARLRFFSFLPRYISWNVEGALLEFWFRLDHRLEMNDILMRIESGGTGNPAAANARNTFNMRRLRFRNEVGIMAWNDCRTWPVKNDVAYIGSLTPEQICLNTSMIVDVPNRRFLKPVFSDAACTDQVGYMDAGLRFGHFLHSLVTTVPSRRMLAGIMLKHRVQELAILQDRGYRPDNWTTLDRRDEPGWWNDRTAGNRENAEEEREIDELEGSYTHREWMEISVGRNMHVGIAKRAKTRGWTV